MNSKLAGYKLDQNLANTKRVFENLVVRTNLNEILSAFSDWAVVGGAVRDVLLSEQADYRLSEPPWQDLDIAVAHESQDALVDALKGASSCLNIRLNSFNGLKATLPSVGSIDLWVTGSPAPREDRKRYQYWKRYLETVDFGVNAIAFAWPNRYLIVHRRWVEDVRLNCVEVLSDHSPRKEIQPLRAIALCAALTRRLCRPAHLGEGVWAEIDRLLDTPEHMHVAFTYLRSKIASGRWRKDHLLPFLTQLIDQPYHASTPQELQFLERLRGIVMQEQVG